MGELPTNLRKLRKDKMEEYVIQHHGILGQKWGVRRYQNADGSLTEAGKKHYALEGSTRATRRDAKRDAKEAATAKMFYGEGAGTRRKRINEVVKQRSKDEAYKRAYDYYYENQDMAKRGAQARAQRRTKDTTKAVTKTTRGIINQVLHTGATVSASAAALYYVAHKTGIDQVVAKYAKTKVSQLLKR